MDLNHYDFQANLIKVKYEDTVKEIRGPCIIGNYIHLIHPRSLKGKIKVSKDTSIFRSNNNKYVSFVIVDRRSTMMLRKL